MAPRQEAESHDQAFEKTQQRLQACWMAVRRVSVQADRQAADAKLQEQRQKQQQQAGLGFRLWNLKVF